KAFKFCIPDLGDKGKQRPDLLIFEPQLMEYAGREVTYDKLTWSERIIAVEVETDPTKHESQVVENFRKNFELGYDVWFVVFSEKHKQYIMDTMNKNDIAEQFYKITLVPPESVERLGNIQNNSVTHLTLEDLEVHNVLKNGGTAKSIADKIGMSTYDVMGILWKLEEKGIVERGYAEIKKTVLDLGHGRSNTTKSKVEYFIPTEESKILEKPQEELKQKPDDKVTVSNQSINANVPGFDLSQLGSQELKKFILKPEYSKLATILLENRGYSVRIVDGEVKLRKRPR
ncbi:MAG: hypothetical protein KGH87_02090, partial [Thaumarchaeota archaeon]|nr:hypothetical protein [Nitrososphaerota archaeon]